MTSDIRSAACSVSPSPSRTASGRSSACSAYSASNSSWLTTAPAVQKSSTPKKRIQQTKPNRSSKQQGLVETMHKLGDLELLPHDDSIHSEPELELAFSENRQVIDILSAAGNLDQRRLAHGGYGTPSSYASEQEMNLYFDSTPVPDVENESFERNEKDLAQRKISNGVEDGMTEEDSTVKRDLYGPDAFSSEVPQNHIEPHSTLKNVGVEELSSAASNKCDDAMKRLERLTYMLKAYEETDSSSDTAYFNVKKSRSCSRFASDKSRRKHEVTVRRNSCSGVDDRKSAEKQKKSRFRGKITSETRLTNMLKSASESLIDKEVSDVMILNLTTADASLGHLSGEELAPFDSFQESLKELRSLNRETVLDECGTHSISPRSIHSRYSNDDDDETPEHNTPTSETEGSNVSADLHGEKEYQETFINESLAQTYSTSMFDSFPKKQEDSSASSSFVEENVFCTHSNQLESSSQSTIEERKNSVSLFSANRSESQPIPIIDDLEQITGDLIDLYDDKVTESQESPIYFERDQDQDSGLQTARRQVDVNVDVADTQTTEESDLMVHREKDASTKDVCDEDIFSLHHDKSFTILDSTESTKETDYYHTRKWNDSCDMGKTVKSDTTLMQSDPDAARDSESESLSSRSNEVENQEKNLSRNIDVGPHCDSETESGYSTTTESKMKHAVENDNATEATKDLPSVLETKGVSVAKEEPFVSKTTQVVTGTIPNRARAAESVSYHDKNGLGSLPLPLVEQEGKGDEQIHKEVAKENSPESVQKSEDKNKELCIFDVKASIFDNCLKSYEQYSPNASRVIQGEVKETDKASEKRQIEEGVMKNINSHAAKMASEDKHEDQRSFNIMDEQHMERAQGCHAGECKNGFAPEEKTITPQKDVSNDAAIALTATSKHSEYYSVAGSEEDEQEPPRTEDESLETKPFVPSTIVTRPSIPNVSCSYESGPLIDISTAGRYNQEPASAAVSAIVMPVHDEIPWLEASEEQHDPREVRINSNDQDKTGFGCNVLSPQKLQPDLQEEINADAKCNEQSKLSHDSSSTHSNGDFATEFKSKYKELDEQIERILNPTPSPPWEESESSYSLHKSLIRERCFPESCSDSEYHESPVTNRRIEKVKKKVVFSEFEKPLQGEKRARITKNWDRSPVKANSRQRYRRSMAARRNVFPEETTDQRSKSFRYQIQRNSLAVSPPSDLYDFSNNAPAQNHKKSAFDECDAIGETLNFIRENLSRDDVLVRKLEREIKDCWMRTLEVKAFGRNEEAIIPFEKMSCTSNRKEGQTKVRALEEVVNLLKKHIQQREVEINGLGTQLRQSNEKIKALEKKLNEKSMDDYRTNVVRSDREEIQRKLQLMQRERDELQKRINASVVNKEDVQKATRRARIDLEFFDKEKHKITGRRVEEDFKNSYTPYTNSQNDLRDRVDELEFLNKSSASDLEKKDQVLEALKRENRSLRMTNDQSIKDVRTDNTIMREKLDRMHEISAENLLLQSDVADYQAELADLREEAKDLRSKCYEMTEENRQFKAEIRDLRRYIDLLKANKTGDSRQDLLNKIEYYQMEHDRLMDEVRRLKQRLGDVSPRSPQHRASSPTWQNGHASYPGTGSRSCAQNAKLSRSCERGRSPVSDAIAASTASSLGAKRIVKERSLSPSAALNYRDLTMERYNQHMDGHESPRSIDSDCTELLLKPQNGHTQACDTMPSSIHPLHSDDEVDDVEAELNFNCGKLRDSPNSHRGGLKSTSKDNIGCSPSRRSCSPSYPGGFRSVSPQMSSTQKTARDTARDRYPTKIKKSLPRRAFAPRSPADLMLGYSIKFTRPGGRLSRGTVRYIGHLPTREEIFIGVELDDYDGKHSGTFQGKKYFTCPTNKGIFTPFSKVIMAWE